MFSSEPTEPSRSRARTAWRPQIPRAAAPLHAWVLVVLLILPLSLAAILALG